MYDRHDPSDLERHVRRLLHQRLGDVVDVADAEVQGALNRGRVGHLYERYLGIPPNSDAGPDIPECGVEVKSVPLKRGKSAFQPKERTFITAIDYDRIVGEDFEGSPLDLKTRHTLYLFYEHQPETAIADFRTIGVLLHERDEVDELMLREAHAHVRMMVREGRAHELSEGDTWGVGAATKDSTGRDIPQPRSHLPARRRAFAWKPQVTARLWQAAKPRDAQGLLQLHVPDEMSALQERIRSRVRAEVGASVEALRQRLAPHLSHGYKSLTSAVSRALIDGPDRDGLETLDRLGVTVRTMRVDPLTVRPKEAVSFPAFDPVELARETWETSELLSRVRSLLFIVFTDRGNIPASQLTTAFFWQPDHADLAVMQDEWERFRDRIAASQVDDLPGQTSTRILHVRPHGRDSTDRLALPNGVPWQRSSFWLNQGYLQELVRQALGR